MDNWRRIIGARDKDPPEKFPHVGNNKRIRTGNKSKLKTYIVGHEVREVLLDLGSYIQIIPNKSW